MNKNIKILFSILILFISHSKLFSQPHTEWVQRYNSLGNYNDYVTDMAIDKSGNVYLTGYSLKSTFDYDIITIKYNSAGIFQWSKSYDGPANGEDFPIGIQIGKSGYIYVGASIQDTGGNYNLDYFVIKYDSNGDTIWTGRFNTFGGINNADVAKSMVVDNSDNIIITGYGGSTCIGCPEAYVTVKWNSNGEIQWSRIYKGPSNSSDNVRDIISDTLNNLYVTGQVLGTMGTITIKYNQLGDTVWIRESSSGGNILEINSDKLYLLEADCRLLQYDLDGNLLWNRSSEGIYTDMKVNDSGFVYISGILGPACITKKYNAQADSIWCNEFLSTPNSGNFSNSIALDNFYNVFISGYTNNNTPWNKFLLVSYKNDGEFKWSVIYYNNAPFLQHEAIKVKTDISGNIYVIGNSQGNGTGWDIVLIKYAMPTIITPISNKIPYKFKLFQNYPNPFNPVTKIKYEVPYISNIEISISDISGRKIFELKKLSHPAGIFNFDFMGSNLSNGTYFLSLIANNTIISTIKLILLK